jgi:hypothetical protein
MTGVGAATAIRRGYAGFDCAIYAPRPSEDRRRLSGPHGKRREGAGTAGAVGTDCAHIAFDAIDKPLKVLLRVGQEAAKIVAAMTLPLSSQIGSREVRVHLRFAQSEVAVVQHF